MRHLCSLVIAVGLLGSALGCHYTAGVCDCDAQNYAGDDCLVAPCPVAHASYEAASEEQPIEVLNNTEEPALDEGR